MNARRNITYSEKGKRLMTFDDFVFQLNRTYTSKRTGETVLYWQRDIASDTAAGDAHDAIFTYVNLSNG